MKNGVNKYVLGLAVILLLTSCSNDPNTPFSIFSSQSSTNIPAKEIYVTEDDLSTPFIVLGPVDYTLNTNFPSFSTQADLKNQAIEYLKQEAVAKYGANVDAIINVVFQENPEQDSYFSPNTLYVRGTAVAYQQGIKPYAKSKKKRKSKPSKSSTSKPKLSGSLAPHRTIQDESDEPEITPSEMLK